MFGIGIDASNNRDSMDAINTHFLKTAVKTPAARTLKDSWVKWFSDLSWFSKGENETMQEASNRRNAFNIANSKSAEEVAQVKQVITTGHSSMTHLGPKDAAGNFPKVPGRTVASAGKAVMPGSRPTIRQGSKGDPVKAWQAIIGVTPDGNFGPKTVAATKAWQSSHGLTPDGVVGSMSWSRALGNSPMTGEQALVTPVSPDNLPAARVPAGAVAPIAAAKKPIPPPKAMVAHPTPVIKASSKPLEPGADTVKPSDAQPVAKASIIPGWDMLPKWGKTTLGIGTGVSALAFVAKKLIR